MSLSDDDRKALVDYRIEKAKKSFEEAYEEDILEAAPKVKQLVEKLIGLNKLAK